MNNRRQIAAFLLACFALSEQMVLAQQSSATLDETLDWLKPQITQNINLPHANEKSSKIKNVVWELDNPSRCILIWNGWKAGTEKKQENLLASVRLSLADFDPQRIETGSFSFNADNFRIVILNITDSQNLLRWQVMNNTSEANSVSFKFKTNSISMTPMKDEMSERVKRAFGHAISLCGGKQGKPKKPEPF